MMPNFILYKALSELLMPVGLCFLLMLVTLFLLQKKHYRAGKICLIISLIFLLLMGLPFIPKLIAKPLEKAYTEPAALPDNIATIVVLSGGIAAPQEAAPEDQIANTTLQRLIKGIILWKKRPNAVLIVSGGSFRPQDGNAETMKNVAITLGVPAAKIITENNSLNTAEEAVYIKPLVGDKPFILVTSAMHLPRSVALFKKLGMHPLPIPTDFTSEGNPLFYEMLIPSAGNIYQFTALVHEYLGLCWAQVRHEI